jgi:hypothetical protein
MAVSDRHNAYIDKAKTIYAIIADSKGPDAR